MKLGERIKLLRKEKGISQEKMAELLNVSRSAIAKWESDGGIPELDNLIHLSDIFEISLDELIGKSSDKAVTSQTDPKPSSFHDYGDNSYDITLSGWNDGVYDAYIIAQDEQFLFYQIFVKKKAVYGMLGKKYIVSVKPAKFKNTKVDISDLNQYYFCRKPVKVETNKKEGISGFFDFRDDDYREVIIDSFEEKKLRLQFGREIELDEVVKIEERTI